MRFTSITTYAPIVTVGPPPRSALEQWADSLQQAVDVLPDLYDMADWLTDVVPLLWPMW